MHAQVTMFSVKPATLTRLIETVKGQVVPDLHEQPGCLRVEFLTRSRINKALLVSFWMTEFDAMEAEKQGVLDQQMSLLEPFVTGPAIVEGYEVSIIEEVHQAQPSG